MSPGGPKWTKNRTKIDPKWPLGAPWASQVEHKSYFAVLGSILEPNLVPQGTAKSTKNRDFARKMPQETHFESNVGLARCVTSFFIALGGIFGQKINDFFNTLLCFLLSFPILEKPCVLQATLLVDSVFRNMLKS